MGTYGSRSGAVGMSAISKALDKVEAKAKKVASHLLEAADTDIVFKDGRFTVAGTDKSAAWGDVSLHAYIAHKFSGAELEPGLKEGAFYDPTNFTFPAGCHICEVEVDPETGTTDVVGWTAVVWVVIIFFLFMLPQVGPINLKTFNYASIAVLVVIGFAGIYWLVSARHWFTGPKVQGTPEELAAIEHELSA